MCKQTDIARLNEAIERMDCFSQTGFSSIAAIANLIVSYLDAEKILSPAHRETVVTALEHIKYLAFGTENSINCCAEGVGSNYRSYAAPQTTPAESEVDHGKPCAEEDAGDSLDRKLSQLQSLTTACHGVGQRCFEDIGPGHRENIISLIADLVEEAACLLARSRKVSHG